MRITSRCVEDRQQVPSSLLISHSLLPTSFKMFSRVQRVTPLVASIRLTQQVRPVSFALRPRLRRFWEDNTPVEKQEETKVATTPMELISMVPPIEFDGRVAVCDGGSGPTGHPRVFINLDNGKPNPCGYCGLRFVQRHHHHHHSYDAAHH